MEKFFVDHGQICLRERAAVLDCERGHLVLLGSQAPHWSSKPPHGSHHFYPSFLVQFGCLVILAPD